MKKKKLVKRFGCLFLAASLAVSGVNALATVQATTKTKFYNQTTSVTFRDQAGIRKISVNAKNKKIKIGAKKVKLTFKKEGLYTVKITNKKKKTITQKICIDKTAPSITGVKNGESYTQPLNIAVKDKYGLSSVTLNGKKVSAPYKITIASEGEYKVSAEDNAGNVREVIFSFNQQKTQATASAPETGSVISSGTTTTITSTDAPLIPNAPAGGQLQDDSATSISEQTPTTSCEHMWVLVSTEIEATCSSSGIGKYKCGFCNGTALLEIPKVDHAFTKLVADEKYEVKKATCTEGGKYYYCCQYCGKAGTEIGEISALGHNFKKIESANCLKEEASETHGNIYYYMCECGEKSSETWDDGTSLNHKSHNFTDTSIVTDENLANEATCTEPERHYYKCTDCNTFSNTETFESKPALGHDYSKTILVELANCQHGNLSCHSCERCGAKTIETIDDGNKTDHDFSKRSTAGKYLKSVATCTKTAEYYYSCVNCGEKGTKTFENGYALGHNYNQKDNKHLKNAATCTQKAEYYYSCANCGGAGTQSYQYGEALGHNYTKKDNKHLKNAATCTKKAEYYYSCANCGEAGTQSYQYGEALGHNYTKKDNKYLKNAATCTKKAEYYYSCANCGEAGTQSYQYGEVLGHDFSKKVASKLYTKSAATCQHDTEYYYACSRENCSEKDSEYTWHDGVKLAHNFKEMKTDPKYFASSATCTEGIKYYYKCTMCNEKGTSTFSVANTALGHAYFPNYNISYSVTASAETAAYDRKYKKICFNEGCNHIDDTNIYTYADSHIDHNNPMVSWQYLYVNSRGESAEVTSGEYTSSTLKIYDEGIKEQLASRRGTIKIEFYDPSPDYVLDSKNLSLSSSRALEFYSLINPTVNRSSETSDSVCKGKISGIKAVYYKVDAERDNCGYYCRNTSEMKQIELDHVKLGYVAGKGTIDGRGPQGQGIVYTEVNLNDSNCINAAYVYIVVEDYAGNKTAVRTGNFLAD